MMLHNFLFIVHFPVLGGEIGVFTVFGNTKQCTFFWRWIIWQFPYHKEKLFHARKI